MNFIAQSIKDLVVIEPKPHIDNRGYFLESFRLDLLENYLGIKINFVQDNESKSTKGVLRGLHYQTFPFEQSKLVRVIKGRVLDVVVDLRKESSTFGNYLGVELSSDNMRQLFIPSGFAHGYIVLSDSAIFSYKVDNYYSKEYERGIAFDDPTLNINWQLSASDIFLSDKDKKHPFLNDANEFF